MKLRFNLFTFFSFVILFFHCYSIFCLVRAKFFQDDIDVMLKDHPIPLSIYSASVI